MRLADLHAIAAVAIADEDKARQELFKLTDSGQVPANLQPVVDSLYCRLGLFPYMQGGTPSHGELLVREIHRLDGTLRSVVLHQEQAEVLEKLLDGKNVILSAPTSFGKSLLIDAVLGATKYKRVVVVIPTLALMDETRRRLERFASVYQIITSGMQKRRSDHVVYVLTPERVLERDDLADVEFFVIDEFYKLSPNEDEDEDNPDDRQIRLSQAFVRLSTAGAKFFMLGPNVRALTERVKTRINAELFFTNFRTVATLRTQIECTEDERLPHLKRILAEHPGQTLVFCKSPASAREVATGLIGGFSPSAESRELLASAADWCRTNIHPNWIVADCLERGIGVHHGRMQRSIAQAMVRLFNDGRIRVLVCTSTLIEGVNTAARNVVVYDNRIAKKKVDYFTFNNIIGRSGRMFRHTVGHAFIFHDPPENDLPTVDIPAAAPDANTPTDILVEINIDRLDPAAREKVQAVLDENGIASPEEFRRNPWLRPTEQIGLRTWLDKPASRQVLRQLSGSQYIGYQELAQIFGVLHKEAGVKLPQAALSASQAAFFANMLSRTPDYATITEKLRTGPNPEEDIQKAIDRSFQIVRDVGEYGGSRMLRGFAQALEDHDESHGRLASRIRQFSARIETRGFASEFYALEEYGIPLQLSLKYLRGARVQGDLDGTLQRAKSLIARLDGLTLFERFLLERDADRRVPVG